jgi:hypothetical protein
MACITLGSKMPLFPPLAPGQSLLRHVQRDHTAPRAVSLEVFEIAADDPEKLPRKVRSQPRPKPTMHLHWALAPGYGRIESEEGKWFAAAKDAGLRDGALQLAARTPRDRCTLTRATRDFADSNPHFGMGAGPAALCCLAQGYGYKVTSAAVWAAYSETLKAAERAGKVAKMKGAIRKLASSFSNGASFVVQILHRELGLP